MPSLRKRLLDSAADIATELARRATELAGRFTSDESDTTTPPPSAKPEQLGAPKPGAPAAPKSGTARTRKPKAKAKAKPSGRGARAKAGPTVEPRETANAAAATPTEGPVATGKAKTKAR